MDEIIAEQADPGTGRPQSRLKRILIGLLVAAAAVVLLGFLFIKLFEVAWGYSESKPRTYAVDLGDLDGDGDLDAFYANGLHEGPHPNFVLINQGGAQAGQPGVFQDSNQRLGGGQSRSVFLSDLDSDGDLDGLTSGLPLLSFFMNDGSGRFTAKNEWDSAIMGAWALALGDLDGDGDPDILAGGCCGPFEPYQTTWLNQGGLQGGKAGAFVNSGQHLDGLGSEGVALGDLDGDEDLDAFVGNNVITGPKGEISSGQPNMVLWNDGSGRLADSGQRLGNARTKAVALGDLDGDGDLDAYCANVGPHEIWINTGGDQGGQPGTFVDSGQRIGDRYSWPVYLADLDADGDLDAAVRGDSITGRYLEIRLNDGRGDFSETGQRISHFRAQAFALADLDSDQDLDVFAGWYPAGYTIWTNQGAAAFTTGK